jgi:hypothetical protein
MTPSERMLMLCHSNFAAPVEQIAEELTIEEDEE